MSRSSKLTVRLGPSALKSECLSGIAECKTVAELHRLVKSDFYVCTPCVSKFANIILITLYLTRPRFLCSCGQGVMEGTRLTAQQLQFGHRFSIRTPGTPQRWKQFDAELAHVFKQLEDEMSKSSPNPDKLVDLALCFYFFWTNFGPISRGQSHRIATIFLLRMHAGTAACGLLALHAILLAAGFEITSTIPKMIQIDFEGQRCNLAHCSIKHAHSPQLF